MKELFMVIDGSKLLYSASINRESPNDILLIYYVKHREQQIL